MEFGAYRWCEINGAVMDSGSSAALRLALVLPLMNMVLCFRGRGGGRAERLTMCHESELELGWSVESKVAVCVCICFCVGGRSLCPCRFLFAEFAGIGTLPLLSNDTLLPLPILVLLNSLFFSVF